MTSFSELLTRQRIMEEYIRRDATGRSGQLQLVINLIREIKERTPTGGVTVVGLKTLPPQIFGYMPLKRRQTDEGAFTDPTRGRDEVTKVQSIFIAQLTVDAERGDYFIWEDDESLEPGKYTIDYVSIRNHDHKLVGFDYSGPGR